MIVAPRYTFCLRRQTAWPTASILKNASICFFLICFSLVFKGGSCFASNIEFLSQEQIVQLNYGVYEVVTPKLESDKITYARKLPFDKLDFIERNEKYYSIGTAFFINEKQLMTAAHVFRLMYFSLYQDFYIRDSEGKVYPVKSIQKYSTLRDMVVFDLQEYPDKVIPLQKNGATSIGETVFSVGNAQGEGIAYRAGQVASFTPEREFGKWKDIRFTSPASPGNSGGPLLNLQGEVVGVIVKKNNSENYNIAVPIDEMANLGEDATFHLRNVVVGLYGVNDNMSRDWFFSAPLPATVEELALPAQESLNAHWVQLLDDLMEEVKDKNMPRGVRFRDYLREQSIIKGLALVTPEEGFKKWSASSWGGEKIPLTAKQNVYKRMGKVSDLHVIVEKPEDVSLVSFLESPQMVMDTILQAISYPREVGGEKVPMTSLGVPAKTEMVEDMLGRKWITSLWDLPYEDLFVHSSCLPYPKGVACLVDTVPNTSRKLGFFDAIHEGYDEFVVGYDGAVDDWEEYCRLDNRFLPKIFQGSKVLREDSTLSVEMNSFSLHFTSDRIKGDSRIHVHLGFASETLLDETLLLFELFPVNGGKSQYRIQSFYEPGVFSSAKYKAKWTAVTNGSGEFTGKVVNKGDKLIIRKGVESTRKQFLSFSGDPVSKIFATGCFYDVSATEMENDCAGFFDAIIFK